jgi:general secretion pathway protein M
VRAIWHWASAALGRLSPREQRLVALFAALLVLSAAYLFVVEPVIAGRARVRQRVETLQRDLATMQQLALRIKRLQADLGAASAAGAAADFSLFAFVDKAAAAAVSRESIASMNPSTRALRDGYVESAVELRVNGVTLPEIVSLLERMEESTQPVYIKRLEIKRRYDDKTHFDATVVAGAMSRT